MKEFIYLLALLTATVQLRWRHNDEYNLTSQLDRVTIQQKQFEQQFLALRKQFQNINDQLKKSVNPSDRINILETSLLQWRQDVFDLSKTIIPSFNLSQCRCQALTPGQKSNLLEHINRIKQNVEELKSKAEKLEKCDKVEQVLSDANKQLLFLDSMKETLQSNCLKSINIGPTIFQTNLYASNWILGNLSIDALIQIYNDRATAYDNITNCPINTPFFDGKKCIICPTDNPVFNIQTMKCSQCQTDQHIDNVQKKCTGGKSFGNNQEAGNIIAPSGYKFQQESGTKCPYEKPYYNGQQCISCNGDKKLFNISSRSCVSCPEGKNYDKTLKDCKQQKNETLDNKTKNESTINWFPQNKTNLTNTNSTNQSSVSWVGQKYNTNPFAKNIISNESIPRDPRLSNCPMDRPYFDGSQCITCFAPNNLFNLSSKQCTSCASGEVYSPDSLSCEQAGSSTANAINNGSSNSKTLPFFVSNLSNLHWTVNDGNSERIYEEVQRMLNNSSAQKCPAGKQFFNGSECISCRDGQNFNFDTKKCQKCADNTKFNLNLHSCVKPTSINEYQTNPITSGNTIQDGLPLMQYLKIYKSNKQKYPQIQDCPKQKPFFDGVSCIACNSQFPYFNLERKLCQICTPGSKYNSQSKQCQSTEGKIIYQGPTIEKMLAGIF